MLDAEESLMAGLNPYYTGRWFLLVAELTADGVELNSLNPYYTGRWFLLQSIRGD